MNRCHIFFLSQNRYERRYHHLQEIKEHTHDTSEKRIRDARQESLCVESPRKAYTE